MKLQEITEAFEFFDSWEDKYRFIIDLGKSLPELPVSERKDDNLVRGCQSQVWLVMVRDAGADTLDIRIDSDAHIVRGLAAIVLAAFAHRTPRQIVDYDIDALFDELGMLAHLSPTRGNGLRAMVAEIRRRAELAAA